jgi:hypothetical protein
MSRRGRDRRRRQLPNGLYIDAFGDRIDLTLRPEPNEIPTTARLLCEVGYDDFGGTCPLCTQALPRAPSGRLGSAEHVPPYAVGGVVRTRTCPDCNSRGSSAEADLVRWWARKHRARFETPGVRGHRIGGGVLLRRSTGAKFALIVTDHTGGVSELLAAAGTNERVTTTFLLPTEGWILALLKAAYLAACVHLGQVPSTADADYARQAVRSGSFGPRGPYVGVGPDSVPFRIFRVYDVDEPGARQVAIGVAGLPWSGGRVPIFGVALGAVAFVTWPLPDLRHKALARATSGAHD